MTVTAKRAKALPLLDKDADLATGELVDESISADAEALINSLNGQFGDELLPWFRSRIGTFRAIHELPPTHEELRIAGEALHFLQEARLRLESLPPVVDGEVELNSWKMHRRPYKGHDGVLSEFNVAAEKVVMVLERAEAQQESRLVMRGRKSASSRDRLLADVATYVIEHSSKRTTKRKVAEVARDLLAAAGVDVPDDLYEVERLIRRQKSGEK